MCAAGCLPEYPPRFCHIIPCLLPIAAVWGVYPVRCSLVPLRYKIASMSLYGRYRNASYKTDLIARQKRGVPVMPNKDTQKEIITDRVISL